MSTLIIAEKPSVAQSIASALGANKRNDGYFEGNGYFVSFAFGHLYTLADAKDYNAEMEKWDLKHYPFIPDDFKYKAIDDERMNKQILILKDLINKSDAIINACDGDREGELIFAEIKQDLDIKKPIKRLWITSHTPKDVAEGMNNLKDDMTALESAGYCRQQIDWIIGINLTAVYSLKTGGAYTLKVGRVLLPTLKLIFDREAEISNFKSQNFYTLKTTFKSNNDTYVGTYHDSEGINKFSTDESLEVIRKAILNQEGHITKKNSDQSRENSPKLFNLSELQGYITNKYSNFTSDLVLKVAQALYEKKYLSYPRTASKYLDDNLIQKSEEVLMAIQSLPGICENAKHIKFHSNKSVFDSSKVDSHPAITPTYIVPNLSTLSENESIVYMEVVKRFTAQFMPPAIFDTLELETNVKGHLFITKGKVLVDEGWKALYSNSVDLEDELSSDNQDDKISAKNLQVGDTVISIASELKESKTKPPAHYTEKTLLSAMEHCGKNVDNDEDVLKGFTIGTPATRAETIKKLLESGYIEFKGKNILITDLGAKVIYHFPIKKLLKVDFTGQIEKTLKDIEQGHYDPNVFMEKMSTFVSSNIEDMKTSDIPIIEKPVIILGKCPDCGGRVIETELAYSCENTRSKTCKFALWKDDKFFKHFGKKLTPTIALDFIQNGKANVKGLKNPNKDNAKFDALIRLVKDTETGYWQYKLDFSNKADSKPKKKTPLKFK